MTVKEMCSCDCGSPGHVFVSSGTFFWGHFCQKTKSFTTKSLPNLDWLKIYKEVNGLCG